MCGMRRLLAASGTLAALLQLVSSPGRAAAEDGVCSAGVVSDTAGVLDDARIVKAAEAFDDRVVVKVLSYVTTDGQDLYRRILDERARCGGWGFRPGGGRSLLVLAVATEDRRLASHYDGRALDRFEAARDHAEVDGMGPSFGNGQWTRGMVDGLAIYARAYTRAGGQGPAPSLVGSRLCDTIPCSVTLSWVRICACWAGENTSTIRSMVCAASTVCSVESTRWPVSAAVIAI